VGHDVRWYTSSKYKEDLKDMNMFYYPFVNAKDIHTDDLDKHFPERRAIKGSVSKLNFDIINFFLNRGPEYMLDIKEIQKSFSLDIIICDLGFSGIPFIKDRFY